MDLDNKFLSQFHLYFRSPGPPGLRLYQLLRWLYARGSGGSRCCDALGRFANQHVVGSRSGASGDAEQGLEGGMPCPAPIEAEHELVGVVLEVGFLRSVVDAQTSTLEI
jgi:hypothetical protein